MINVSITLDVSLSKLVFGFISLSAAAGTVYYLSSKNENKLMKVEDGTSSKGNNDLIAGESPVSGQTHIENEHISESKSDKSNIENNAPQYDHEKSQKQIISDKEDEYFNAGEESQTSNKFPPKLDTNSTFPNKGDTDDVVDENKISNLKLDTNISCVGLQSNQV